MTETEAQSEEFCLLAIDPGKDKCGVALVRGDRRVILQQVVPADRLIPFLKELESGHTFQKIVVGNGTYSGAVESQLKENRISPDIILVDETNTTLEARRRYFADHPPKGLRRLVPRTLLTPDKDYDDYAAILLAERFLESRKP